MRMTGEWQPKAYDVVIVIGHESQKGYALPSLGSTYEWRHSTVFPTWVKGRTGGNSPNVGKLAYR